MKLSFTRIRRHPPRSQTGVWENEVGVIGAADGAGGVGGIRVNLRDWG